MQEITRDKSRNNSQISGLFKVISQVVSWFDVIECWEITEKCEPAYKPGSVEDNYSSAACVTTDL
jgi:hypothetical protein